MRGRCFETRKWGELILLDEPTRTNSNIKPNNSSPKKEFDFKSVALQTFFTGPITGAASGFFGRFLKDVEGDIFTVPVLSADIDIIGHDLSGLIFFFSDLLKQYLPTNNDRDNHQECPCD